MIKTPKPSRPPDAGVGARAEQLSAQQLRLLEEQARFGVTDAVGEEMAHYRRPESLAAAEISANTSQTAKPESTAPSSSTRLQRTGPTKQPALILSTNQQRAKEMAAQAQNLEQLRQMVNDYEGCPLKATASQMVFGTGVKNPLVMIIGEGPGSEEDRLGIPFVGPSGRLIQRCLSIIGVNCHDNLYITNSVYWRPPGDRTPTDAEVAACQPFVARQIALLKPRILLLVGARAAKSFLGVTSGITRLRGGWYSLAEGLIEDDVASLAMFHPAYLFRNHSQKRLFWQDIMALRRRIDDMALPVPWPREPLAGFRENWRPEKLTER